MQGSPSAEPGGTADEYYRRLGLEKPVEPPKMPPQAPTQVMTATQIGKKHSVLKIFLVLVALVSVVALVLGTT